MKWLLILITLSTSDNECAKNQPLPLLKHSDELYNSKKECDDAFRNSDFYKLNDGQIVGFCLAIEPMLLSPKQLSNLIPRPRCP